MMRQEGRAHHSHLRPIRLSDILVMLATRTAISTNPSAQRVFRITRAGRPTLHLTTDLRGEHTRQSQYLQGFMERRRHRRMPLIGMGAINAAQLRPQCVILKTRQGRYCGDSLPAITDDIYCADDVPSRSHRSASSNCAGVPRGWHRERHQSGPAIHHSPNQGNRREWRCRFQHRSFDWL